MHDSPKGTAPAVAVIDDSHTKREYLQALLVPDFTVHCFASGKEAMQAMPSLDLQCILLDIEMPDEDGFAVLERLKTHPTLARVPVIFVTSLTDRDMERRGLACGASDFVNSQVAPEIIQTRVANLVDLHGYRCSLEARVQEKTRTIEELHNTVLVALSDLVECRDANTAGHAQRTHDYVKVLIAEMRREGVYADELTDAFAREAVLAAPLHDIGKVGIRDAVLNKPGRLTPEEFEEMKRHTYFGASAIAKAMNTLHGEEKAFLRILYDMAFAHHEHWDGTGYPRGLKGVQIPLSGRIMAIADVYDALISRRPYKEPIAHAEAVKMIQERIGSDFDPAVGEAFMRCQDKFEAISCRHRGGLEDMAQPQGMPERI